MSTVAIGPDLAKSVFPVHGVNAAGRTVLRRRLARSELGALFAKQPCLPRRDGSTLGCEVADEAAAIGWSKNGRRRREEFAAGQH